VKGGFDAAWPEAPVFGSREEGRVYVVRPSAYALVRNPAGEVAVVETPVGCFLPGGGADADETPEETIRREGKEECGFVLAPRGLIGLAVENCYSIQERKYFEKRCVFYEAEITERHHATEPDHHLHWVGAERAIEMLFHESHRWVVRSRCVEGPGAG
jgi:8-oxo-dGTP diphosphatase